MLAVLSHHISPTCVFVPLGYPLVAEVGSGVGLDRAVEMEMNSYTATEGYISREELAKLTQSFAEIHGQTVYF